MKVLIFGGAGMVGSSVSSVLKNSSYIEKVSVSTRKDTDLFSYEQTFNKIDKEQPNIIINCAAMVGGIVANNSLPFDFIVNNLKINLNIIESLRSKKNINLINLGSSCIYPLGAKVPISENELMGGSLEPTNSAYAMAKLSSIEMGAALSRQYGNNVLNLMPTNLYGERDNFDEKSSHVIPGLIAKIHKAKINTSSSFNVWGSGKPLREFLHVDDLSNAILFLIKNNITTGIYNVGSGEEVSILKLANTIKSIIGFKGDLNFDKNFPDGNPRKLLDSSKLKNLGWAPAIGLEQGLKKTYSWFLSNSN